MGMMMTSAPSQGVGRQDLVGPAVCFLTVIAAGVFFHEGLTALVVAWQTAEYSHGPLIPLLSGLLFLRHLKTVPVHVGPVTDRWPGVIMLCGALALGLIGKFARIPDIVAYAMIVFVGGLVLVNFGWRRGRQFWPAVLHLVFMLPLPGVLYWKLSTTLQFISSEFGVWIIRLFDIPVFLDGNIIDLGVYKLHVAEACSGLRYLFPIMSFSYVFAALYKGPIWHKAVLLLSAAPLAVFMNSVRIGIIGVIVNSYGLDHVEGIAHLMEGWVIFISCVLMLFGMAWIMLRLQRTPMSLSEALDLDLTALTPQLQRLRLIQPSVALIVGCALFVTAAATWQLAPQRTIATIERQSLSVFPPQFDDWRLAATQRLEPDIEAVLAADDYFSGTFYQMGDNTQIELFVAWYRDQTRGGIHSPEVCLPSGGWEMAEINIIDVADRIGVDGAFPVNRAIIQKGQSRLMVYYWFEQFGGRTASDILAKGALLRDAILHGRTDGALVRLITPLGEGEDPAVAEDRLISMMKPMTPELAAFVPHL